MQIQDEMILHLPMETEWCIYASVGCVIIGSDNGLVPVRHQTIT